MKLFLYLLILQLQLKRLGGDSCVHCMYCFGGKKWRMPCFKKCFRFWKMEYNCRKLWSSAIQFQASLGLPMRQKSDSEIPLRLWLHLRFLVQELAIHLHSTRHDTLSVQFPLFCLPVYQSKVYLVNFLSEFILHFSYVRAEKNVFFLMDVKCKIQYFLTERNQRAALNNTGCIPKSRIQKKSLSFQTNDGPNKPQKHQGMSVH